MPITDQEKVVMEKTGQVWNEFLKLPFHHPDDNNDFRFHLHALQNMILGRSAYRELHNKKEEELKDDWFSADTNKDLRDK